jgi:predicted amidophosphoribosyltransferase
MSSVHICAPSPTKTAKEIDLCPTCGKNTEFCVQYYEWYDPQEICLECGEEFAGVEMIARPFARGWREKNKERAKKILEANR